MHELCANLSTLFTEWPLIERPARARACGFRWAELRGLEGRDPHRLAKAFQAADLRCRLLNADAGDLTQGELGFAADPALRGRFRGSLEAALDAAEALEAPLIHVMAGRCDADLGPETQHSAARDAYAEAAERAAARRIGIVIEPLAPSFAPDYVFTDLAAADDFVRAIDAPGLGILFDLFHLQLGGGDIIRRFRKVASHVHHVQMAAVPDRGEPGSGELDISFVLPTLARLGYTGPVGCEYVPREGTLAGLGWAAPWGITAPEGGA
jgi:hydroxypyruvate isomerase